MTRQESASGFTSPRQMAILWRPTSPTKVRQKETATGSVPDDLSAKWIFDSQQKNAAAPDWTAPNCVDNTKTACYGRITNIKQHTDIVFRAVSVLLLFEFGIHRFCDGNPDIPLFDLLIQYLCPVCLFCLGTCSIHFLIHWRICTFRWFRIYLCVCILPDTLPMASLPFCEREKIPHYRK